MDKNVLEFRRTVQGNILKAFEGDELQKAVYVDNAQNRKLGRVGKEYGGKKNNIQDTKHKDKIKTEKKVFKVGRKVNYRIMPNHKYTVLAAHEDGTYDIADRSYRLGAKDNEGGSRINNVDGSYLSKICRSKR
jgi:hypothetical protein